MRLGIYGGTFDPVHYGHLLLAESCREQLALDEVWFLPAAVPPHKQGLAISPAEARLDMLELATSGYPPFRVSRLEIDRGGVSYTVDTLEALHAEEPGRTLFLLLGADSLWDLPHWRQPDRICQLATPVFVHRPGVPVPDFQVLAPWVGANRLAEISRHRVEMPHIGLASRELRARVARGQSLRFRLPRAVQEYILAQGLYRDAKLEGDPTGGSPPRTCG